MSIINKALNFWAKSANLGKPKGCTLTLENVSGFIIVFDGFKIPFSELSSHDSMLTYLQEQSMNSNPENRLYYVSMLNDFTDSTSKAEKKISGTGVLTGVSETPHLFDLEIENLGIEFFKRLRRFNLRNDICVYPITDDLIGGKLNADGDFLPIKAKFYTNIPTFGKITADPTKYTACVGFTNPKALVEKLDAIKLNVILPYELAGLTDLTVTATDNVDSICIEISESLTGRNFITNYYSELKANNCIFVDGVAKKIDTIQNGKGYINNVIYGSHTVSLISPYALAQFGIGSLNKGGYEGNEANVTVTQGSWILNGGTPSTTTWDLNVNCGNPDSEFTTVINCGNA